MTWLKQATASMHGLTDNDLSINSSKGMTLKRPVCNQSRSVGNSKHLLSLINQLD